MRIVETAFALALLAGAPAPASADCACRAPGYIAHHGETVCLKTPAGPRLARCEMVLNNASWTFLPDPCPEASLTEMRSLAAALSPTPEIAVALR